MKKMTAISINIIKYSLNNFKIDDFSYRKANKTLKKVIDNNYI